MLRQSYPTQLHDHLGNNIRIPSKPFAVGGEGAVFDVVGKPDLVAKLYSKPQSSERCDKLRAMARLCSTDLLRIAAWPTATLSNGNPAAVEGILMPRIVDHKEIHHLYSVIQRKKDYPEADWGFLLHTARNCAIAFEAIHQHDHVVGDVNQKNVMVSKKGIVALVDCDSFQVAEGSRIFRCSVGVPEYTPPELQGKKFASVDRTANHDNFGLAVLVFHLLMMGRHPFAGVPQANADIPIDSAIKESYYAYARNPTKLKPPPNIPPVTMLDAAIIELFERAFGSPRRPTASEWRAGLDSAMKQLRRCTNDPKHAYPGSTAKCPWCELIAVARVMFFLPGQGSSTPAFRPEDIEQLLRKLAGMQINFPAYVRPKPVLPIKIVLPPGLRSIRKPFLQPHPIAPSPVQKPALASSPAPPDLLPRPQLRPLPAPPSLVERPRLASYPVSHPFPMPTLRGHPPIVPDPPLPRLLYLPPRPDYPPPPTLGPQDPFLANLCLVCIMAGMLAMLIAWQIGVVIMGAFGAWWIILVTTENTRREMALKSLGVAHKYECERIDEEYDELCRPQEEANQRRLEAWEAECAAMAAKYQRQCKRIDDENYRQLAAWEEGDALRKAEHDRARAKIDAANRVVLDEWKAKNAVITAEYDRVRNEIEQANRCVLASWEAENASRHAAYLKACREIEHRNRQLTSAWEALNASRQAEHDRACREIDEENRRLIAEWEAANAPWLAEERRWRERVSWAESEIRRLESDLYGHRRVTEEKARRRKDEASGIAAKHDRVRQDYEKELGQAKVNSKRIQLEEYLDKALIRTAKLTGITGARILALESFGIETANDVLLLNNQKVPGIGPVYSKRLLDWRKSLEKTFRPQQSLPESEKNRIASRYTPVMLPLGQSIQSAIDDLGAIGKTHGAQEVDTIKAIAAAVQNLAIAEAYVSMMKVA